MTISPASCLTLPFPPALNSYYRHVVVRGQPRTLISEKGREYRERVKRVVGPVATLRGRLAVCVLACPPDRRARDLDGMHKALLDALTHAGVWADDSQIDALVTLRGERVQGGSVVVRIEPMQADALAMFAREMGQERAA